MQIRFDDLTREEADSYSLVLTASGIYHRLDRGQNGWDIWVAEGEAENAGDTICLFLKENPPAGPDRDTQPVRYRKTYSGIGAGFLLLVCHTAATVLNTGPVVAAELYGSSAAHILSGELYRTVTALLFHANILHLAGNVVGITIFGTAVCAMAGWGQGWLLVLLTGVLGNLANAVLYRTDHVSIGASTAVFGAIGILSASQFIKKRMQPGQRLRAWLPLGGGLALLAILGSGRYSDIMAHLFGFLAGIFLGVLYRLLIKRSFSDRYQAGFLFITMAIIIVSWRLATGPL